MLLAKSSCRYDDQAVPSGHRRSVVVLTPAKKSVDISKGIVLPCTLNLQDCPGLIICDLSHPPAVPSLYTALKIKSHFPLLATYKLSIFLYAQGPEDTNPSPARLRSRSPNIRTMASTQLSESEVDV